MDILKQTYDLSCGRFKIQLGDRTHVMGILNVTPDSFSDRGKYFDKQDAVDHALKMEAEGADFIDVGGESSRPGSRPVSADEELRRILPVLEVIIPRLKIPVSIDSCKPEVARKAIEYGASLMNDIQALSHPEMAEIAVEYNLPVILMHMQKTPETMQLNPRYESVVEEIALFFEGKINRAISSGLSKEQIILDPGIGFGKTVDHNLKLLRSVEKFYTLNRPLLIGASNKTFIGKILDLPVEKRLAGSLATVAWAVLKGVHIVRVHDVGSTQNVIRMIEEIRGGQTR
ncbi:MAG: dihydropteroate synthase [Nitrospiria bacterium]